MRIANAVRRQGASPPEPQAKVPPGPGASGALEAAPDLFTAAASPQASVRTSDQAHRGVFDIRAARRAARSPADALPDGPPSSSAAPQAPAVEIKHPAAPRNAGLDPMPSAPSAASAPSTSSAAERLAPAAPGSSADPPPPEVSAALVADPQFQSLASGPQQVLVDQLRNYPDPRAARNLARLAGKEWFRSGSAADQQRTAKLIAFDSRYDAGDTALLQRTLDQFLAPDAPLRMAFDASGPRYGSALNGVFHLNRRYLPDGDGPVPESDDDTMHLCLSTLPHEVNHLLNNDRRSRTFAYFMDEYRANVVGYRAQNGRYPNVSELRDKVVNLLRSYPEMHDLLFEEQIRPSAPDAPEPTEGAKLVAFLRQYFGRSDLTASTATDLPPAEPNAPVPMPTGNLDNH